MESRKRNGTFRPPKMTRILIKFLICHLILLASAAKSDSMKRENDSAKTEKVGNCGDSEKVDNNGDSTKSQSSHGDVVPDEVDSLLCPFEDDQLCWPKCCFANQVFFLDRLNCDQANEDAIILHKPDIYSIRYFTFFTFLAEDTKGKEIGVLQTFENFMSYYKTAFLLL
jgi:hypothetical protein